MMTPIRLISAAAVLLATGALILIPDWFEDPRRLAPGEWKDAGRRGTIDVTESTLTLRGFGPEDPIPYEWVQTEDEPYTLLVTYGSYRLMADITFNGKNEVIADLDVMDKLPSDIADTLREKNRHAGRPENEFRLLFRRVLPKN